MTGSHSAPIPLRTLIPAEPRMRRKCWLTPWTTRCFSPAKRRTMKEIGPRCMARSPAVFVRRGKLSPLMPSFLCALFGSFSFGFFRGGDVFRRCFVFLFTRFRIQLWPDHENIVGSGVPGVVDADKEQQKCRGAAGEKRGFGIGNGCQSRDRQRGV